MFRYFQSYSILKLLMVLKLVRHHMATSYTIKARNFTCYHHVDPQVLSISCIGHFNILQSVYNLWCCLSFSDLQVGPLMHTR